jgi:hypothetical protein
LNDLFRVPSRHSGASHFPFHSVVIHIRCSSCEALDLCLEIYEPLFQSLSRRLVRVLNGPRLTLKTEFPRRLFKHKPHNDPLLLLYRDDPCVVIGRNQNPWKEVNMTELRRVGVPFIRRRSGGGTVYHVSHISARSPLTNAERYDPRTSEIPTIRFTFQDLHSTGTIPPRSSCELSSPSVSQTQM